LRLGLRHGHRHQRRRTQSCRFQYLAPFLHRWNPI
jgi:hypothetical protein